MIRNISNLIFGSFVLFKSQHLDCTFINLLNNFPSEFAEAIASRGRSQSLFRKEPTKDRKLKISIWKFGKIYFNINIAMVIFVNIYMVILKNIDIDINIDFPENTYR